MRDRKLLSVLSCSYGNWLSPAWAVRTVFLSVLPALCSVPGAGSRVCCAWSKSLGSERRAHRGKCKHCWAVHATLQSLQLCVEYVCSGNSRVSKEPLSRKRWGGGRQAWGRAWVLALDTCYTEQNLGLHHGFALFDRKVQVIIIQLLIEMWLKMQ